MNRSPSSKASTNGEKHQDLIISHGTWSSKVSGGCGVTHPALSVESIRRPAADRPMIQSTEYPGLAARRRKRPEVR